MVRGEEKGGFINAKVMGEILVMLLKIQKSYSSISQNSGTE